MYDINDFLQRARKELSEYDGYAQRFEQLISENDRRLAELGERKKTVWQQLGASAFPQANETELPALANRLRLPGLTTIGKEITARRAAIAARLAEIEALGQYRQREVRRGQIDHQLEEEAPVLDFAREGLQKMESLPGMRELVEKGWGTPEYPHQGWLRYFNREFLHDWQRADAIVAALEVSDFGEAAAQFRERVEQVTVLGETVQRLRGELTAIEELEREQAALTAEREALPLTLQTRVGQTISQTLAVRGRDAVRDLPAPEEALRLVTANEGIEQQIHYLEETSGRIRADLAQMLERSGRLRDEMHRYESDSHRYRNKRFSDEQFGKRFGRGARYAKLHDRYTRVSETVYVFNDYDRGFMVSDFLWWDLMTDGRMDGNFIPEVAEWRDNHPAQTYTSDTDLIPATGDFAGRDDS